ncbi:MULTISPECIES: RHS repeat-associated core domain-containing protein, partial [unclassified Pseudomonas]|uniref:RHS repeat-associated core domain-containing protein n=1 Tax=unclassified Pseudomonas TaxID=196821 RepID=UPI0024484CDA
GTPLRLTGEQGKTLWQGQADDWGAIDHEQGETNQPIRFQGQYRDEESGLYYNRYRYYAPELGRYVTQDPIGLLGGNNPYLYPVNPAQILDVLGLSPSSQDPVLSDERFYGERRAMEVLKNNDCDANKAWHDIRKHRYTYRGLREADRNAEHYLFALSEVRDNSYNWGVMHLMTTGYHVTKFYTNLLGGDHSPYRGSPPSYDEMLAGHMGSQDGLFGVPCKCP